ncbi:hypothetical protein [Mucilaginibacter endophyticus]|uniref:hypothetical protein n=1 Tax=Mucilaginibacter endophyticus TaxID=2675003 RepID=UPI000E0CDD76|nr:hypothetical protein [Mucilaginibacter endophyticus]
MKKELVYSFKVFMTAVIIGAILTGVATVFSDPVLYRVSDIFIGFFYMVPVGIVFFIPSWFFLAVILRRFTKRNISPFYIKIILSILSVFFVIQTLFIFDYHSLLHTNYWPSIFPMFASYCCALFISVWIYKIKAYDKNIVNA